MEELLELYEFNELLMMKKYINKDNIRGDIIDYKIRRNCVIMYFDSGFSRIYFGTGETSMKRFYDVYERRVIGK